MRLVDPAFGRENRASDLAHRLELLEKKMAEVLAASQPAGSTTTVAAVQAAGPGLTPVAVAGNSQADNQGSTGETRLPVAGYMDFHLNKDAGEPFRPDFHRFVLLFGHSFSERIKFWSELEVEHALVEGGEESGEVALEQAYLDFLIKPAFNLRAGMMLTPVGHHQRAARAAGVQRRGASFCGDADHSDHLARTGIRLDGRPRPRLPLSRVPDIVAGCQPVSMRRRHRRGADRGLRCVIPQSGEGRPPGVRRGAAADARREHLLRTRRVSTSPGVNPRVTIGEFDGRYSFRRLDFRGLFANTWVSQAGELNWRLRTADRGQSERREPDARVLL